MHMFFVGVAKRGHHFSVEERQHFIDTVRREVVFSAHIQRVVHIAPTPDSIVVGVSNEPDGGWQQTWRRQTFMCGYCVDAPGLARLDATLTLSKEASQVAGRFSVLVVDRLRGRFALATQPARIDSIFAAENDRFAFFGNQASVLSVLRDGTVRYAPEQLVSFLNSGFFAHDDTPYRGVRCVGAFTTIQVVGGRITHEKVSLSTLRGKGPGQLADESLKKGPSRASLQLVPSSMSADFVRAFAPLKSATSIDLALSGGMDSRVILAGAVAAGLAPDCFTRAHGDSNRAEVWVAQRLAQLANMRHRTVRTTRFVPDGSPRAVTLEHTALLTLTASDGMLGCQYPVAPVFWYYPVRNLSGGGGEILRGGYGERIARATKDQVTAHMRQLWNHSPQFFHPDLVAEQDAQSSAYVRAFPDDVSPADVLDYLYVEVRCGRWSAASTWASTRSIRPLLDNVVVRDALATPKRLRQRQIVHRQLIADLLPAAKDFPLANKFWHGTSAAERDALLSAWPEAFTEPKKPAKEMRSSNRLPADDISAIKQYVVDAGRLDLFAGVLRVDEVKRYLNSEPKGDGYAHRFLSSLYSAAVLLSEPWRELRNSDLEGLLLRSTLEATSAAP